MKTINTPRFKFLSFDTKSKEHMEALYLFQDDPSFNRYFGNIRNYFTTFDFGIADLSDHYLTFLNDDLVGFVSLYTDFNCGSIDYGALPEYRSVKMDEGLTIAGTMTKEFMDEIFRRQQMIEFLRAYIDYRNVRSIEMAKSVGFKLYQVNEHILHDEYRIYR